MYGPCAYADFNSTQVFGLSGGGYIKGKSVIAIVRNYQGKKRNFGGQHFWARGCCISTVRRDEATVRRYIQEQEVEDQRIEQLRLSDEW
jgi:putative transposase